MISDNFLTLCCQTKGITHIDRYGFAHGSAEAAGADTGDDALKGKLLHVLTLWIPD